MNVDFWCGGVVGGGEVARSIVIVGYNLQYIHNSWKVRSEVV